MQPHTSRRSQDSDPAGEAARAATPPHLFGGRQGAGGNGLVRAQRANHRNCRAWMVLVSRKSLPRLLTPEISVIPTLVAFPRPCPLPFCPVLACSNRCRG
jgi:hypothetical protein